MTPRTIAHHKYNKQSETCLISNEMQLRLQEFPSKVFEAFVLLFVVFGIFLYSCWVFSHLLLCHDTIYYSNAVSCYCNVRTLKVYCHIIVIKLLLCCYILIVLYFHTIA